MCHYVRHNCVCPIVVKWSRKIPYRKKNGGHCYVRLEKVSTAVTVPHDDVRPVLTHSSWNFVILIYFFFCIMSSIFGIDILVSFEFGCVLFQSLCVWILSVPRSQLKTLKWYNQIKFNIIKESSFVY